MVARGFAGDARRQAIRVRGGKADDIEQQRAEHLVEAGYAADADAAEGVAVIGVFPGEVFGAVVSGRGSGLSPVLERHFEGDFDRGRAVVGEEDVVQAGGGDFDEPPGQPIVVGWAMPST